MEEEEDDIYERLYRASVETRKYRAEQDEVCIPDEELKTNLSDSYNLFYYLAHLDRLPKAGTK
jgi:hypothetical protein